MRVFLSLVFLAIFAFGDFKGLSPKMLQDKIDKNIVLIDIRTPPEWKELGVVPTSKKIMFFDEKGNYDVQSWLNEFSKYVKDKNQAFVLICRSGNRTSLVGEFLSKQMGYENVFHLEHGIKSWIRENRKVEEN
ncbi:MAG: rhodanese-like domain-containing protein [Arcobacter sp.]|uniref:rhodanese-like domain-containing protein n=1 Tax=uncultured Arcobacter sp. TaxID=165434 RepID=UPI000CABD48B|nr:rhodanese-like domain-containing protein [uncultured Arcobacter sp.]PLY11018.1 MAG: rhodanese-like domain-containing protein [Arcobacter sp.]